MATIESERSRAINLEDRAHTASQETDRLTKILFESQENIRIKHNNDEENSKQKNENEKNNLIQQIEDLKEKLFEQFQDFSSQKELIKKQIHDQDDEQNNLFTTHYEQLKRKYAEQNDQLNRLSLEFENERRANELIVQQSIKNVEKITIDNESLRGDLEALRNREEKIRNESAGALENCRINLSSELEESRKELDSVRGRASAQCELLRDEQAKKIESVREKAEMQVEALRLEVLTFKNCLGR